MNDCHDTPRTDAFEVSPEGTWLEFARELERELNEASANRALEVCIERNAKLEDENARLKKTNQLIMAELMQTITQGSQSQYAEFLLSTLPEVRAFLEISVNQIKLCQQTKKTQE